MSRGRKHPAGDPIELTQRTRQLDRGIEGGEAHAVCRWIISTVEFRKPSVKRLPLAAIKIDQAFVRDIVADADDQKMVGAIAAMAHELGAMVVAEGVESAEQLATTRRLGCNAAQGFLIGRATGVASVEALFAATMSKRPAHA